MLKVSVRSSATELHSRARRKRAESLAVYVRAAQTEITAPGMAWSDNRWKGVGVFVKLNSARGTPKTNIDPATLLDSRFIDFAKAYIRERHHQNPGESRSCHIDRFLALRLIEASLIDLHAKADPLTIGRDALDYAVELAKKNYSGQTRYKAGRALQAMTSTLVLKGILPLELKDWMSSIGVQSRPGYAVGSEGDKARLKKLPDAYAVEVLAEIFNRNLDTNDGRYHRDIYTTSVTALILSAPSRGQEVHRLPAELLVKATDKFGNQQTGMRLHASKGFGAYVKWVWSGMVPVAEKAVERLTAITANAREIARHLENPATRNRFFRHAACPNVADDEPLTSLQVCLALGLSTKDLSKSLHAAGLSNKRYEHTLNSLWANWVVPRQKKIAPHFPYVSKKDKSLGCKGGLKFSNALFCMLAGQLSSFKTSPILIWMPSLNTGFSKDIAPTRAGKAPNIFDRYGYSGPGGVPLKLSSHQMRHLLNTEAQRVNMPDELIAHWSGRLRVKQNETYDNRSEQERVDQVRPVVEALDAQLGGHHDDNQTVHPTQFGHWTVAKTEPPRSCFDLDIQPRLAGIKTEYGECYHDWALAPCEGMIACLDCQEHDCIKSSDQLGYERLERVERLYHQVTVEVSKAQTAVAEEDWGAQEWLGLQQRYAAKLEQLIALLKSSDIPERSIIRLTSAQHPTHLHRVLRSVAVQALEDGSSALDVMQQMLSAVSHTEQCAQPITVYRPNQCDTIEHVKPSSRGESDGT